MTVDLTEATIGQDGQIIITGEDGQGLFLKQTQLTTNVSQFDTNAAHVSNWKKEKKNFHFQLNNIIHSGYPVSVSGMITLPVSSSVYQSMVANIQQIHTNSDGQLCITPMQVQKSGHQHSINHINGTNIGGNLIENNCNVAPCISSVNSSFSNVNSGINSIIANNCQTNSNSQYASVGSEMPTNLNCNNNPSTNNSNLLELCRVLSQSTNGNNTNCNQPLHSFNNNLSQNCHDRKQIKSKKTTTNHRNQFLSSSNFGTSTSITFSNETNGIQRNFMEQSVDEIKSDTNNDNNNNNNNHSEKGNGNDNNHDLKCEQLLMSSDAGGGDSSKANKSNIIPIAIQISDTNNRNIKMECEIDVA